MVMRLELYNALVNKVPGIRERYQTMRKKTSGTGRIKCWLSLIWWNFSYHILRRQRNFEQDQMLEKKRWDASKSESESEMMETPEKMAERLEAYDVVSFDVFDTLIFRPFSRPTDLFFETGRRLGYPDFERIRKEMEWRAREKKYQESRTREITLDEIWNMMERETGILKEKGMETELDCEMTYGFANPYMKEVVETLKKNGKKIIVTSDMYLRKTQIQELLKRCGYPEFDKYYVSCEYGVSKGDKGLYEQIKKDYGTDISYVHVGDNPYSDQKKAREAGFDSVPYKNVNDIGETYRSEDMSVITGSMYRGIVNAWIHNGSRIFGKDYEFGFIYGGLFVTGYCQFIHEYAIRHRVDKILFLSRDGDILKQVYDRIYPEDKTEYVYWSRKAATILCAGYFKYDYFRRFLYHKINQDYTLEQIFSSMKLEDMLEEFCRNYSCKKETKLTEVIADQCKQYLMENWEAVLDHYQETRKAGGIYYGKVLQDCKHVLAVDIGWAGSGAIALNYLVNHVWNLDCKVTGMLAGTNTCHNAEPDASESFLQEGTLISYFYSQRENRDLWKFHDLNQDHNLYLEQLLCSPTPGFEGFAFDSSGKVMLQFGKKDSNEAGMRQIQKGILDFADEWIRHFGRDNPMARISGRDAYGPLALMLGNKSFLREIAGIFHLNANVD